MCWRVLHAIHQGTALLTITYLELYTCIESREEPSRREGGLRVFLSKGITVGDVRLLSNWNMYLEVLCDTFFGGQNKYNAAVHASCRSAWKWKDGFVFMLMLKRSLYLRPVSHELYSTLKNLP